MKVVGFCFFMMCAAVGFATEASAQAGRFVPGAPMFQGFIPVRSNRQLYVDYVQAKPGFPTLILMNGLTYSTRQYEAYAQALIRRGVGVLRFDFDGMGQSLLRYAPSTAPYPYDQQAKDTKALLGAMGIRPPYSIAGLSYGGGIGIAYALMYPQDVRHLILMAPFTEPLESQNNWILTQIRLTRISFPANPATDDELYDYFLHQTVYSTYPSAEPIVLENPYKLEGVYNLVRGIRKFRAIDFADRLPAGTVHMMTAGSDQYIPANVLERFWSRVAPAARMSRIVLYQSEHKMPEAFPEFTAKWTWQILKGNPLLRGGRVFEGFPVLGSVKSGGLNVPIED